MCLAAYGPQGWTAVSADAQNCFHLRAQPAHLTHKNATKGEIKRCSCTGTRTDLRSCTKWEDI